MNKYAYFAGGCFWCITPIFEENEGVIGVTAGYSGGDEVNPSYQEVKSQTTLHRETIKIEYDDSKITFEDLLNIFIENVDYTDDGGQFIDRGYSYTLAIYYQNDQEKATATKIVNSLENAHISIEGFKAFYDAEEEHQDYYKKNPIEFEEELIKSGRK